MCVQQKYGLDCAHGNYANWHRVRSLPRVGVSGYNIQRMHFCREGKTVNIATVAVTVNIASVAVSKFKTITYRSRGIRSAVAVRRWPRIKFDTHPLRFTHAR
jgi:hypothetical protein